MDGQMWVALVAALGVVVGGVAGIAGTRSDLARIQASLENIQLLDAQRPTTAVALEDTKRLLIEALHARVLRHHALSTEPVPRSADRRLVVAAAIAGVLALFVRAQVSSDLAEWSFLALGWLAFTVFGVGMARLLGR